MAAEFSLGRKPEEKVNHQNRAIEDSDRDDRLAVAYFAGSVDESSAPRQWAFRLVFVSKCG